MLLLSLMMHFSSALLLCRAIKVSARIEKQKSRIHRKQAKQFWNSKVHLHFLEEKIILANFVLSDNFTSKNFKAFKISQRANETITIQHDILTCDVCKSRRTRDLKCRSDRCSLIWNNDLIKGYVMINQVPYGIHFDYSSTDQAHLQALVEQQVSSPHDFISKVSPILVEENDADLIPLFTYPEGYPIYVDSIVNLTIEVLIVVDVFRLEILENDVALAVEHSLLVASIANNIFKRASFERAHIELIISGIIVVDYDLFETGRDSVNSMQLIETLNAWRNTNIESLHPHDVLHLFSGAEFKDNVLGLAYLKSSCDVVTACTRLDPGYCQFDSDTGEYSSCCLRSAAALSTVGTDLNDARTVAHEIGHQLGLDHDTEDTNQNCKERGSVMSAVSYRGDNWLDDEWSPCSADIFDEILTTPDYFDYYNYHSYGCLLNNPNTDTAFTFYNSLQNSTDQDNLSDEDDDLFSLDFLRSPFFAISSFVFILLVLFRKQCRRK